MKVALVICHYDAQGGGAERWTDRHARWLLQHDFEVHLIAHRFRGAPDGAVCHLVQRRWWEPRKLGFARAVERFLASTEFEIVHDMGDGWAGDVIMPHHGTRRGSQQQNLRLMHPSVRWIRSLSYLMVPRYLEFAALERRKYDEWDRKLFIAVSSMVGENMHRFHGIPRERIRVVYNGVNVDRFAPSRDQAIRQHTRIELGVPEDETMFLHVAHNFRLKGLDALLKAVSNLKKQGHSAHLIVVGDGQISKYERLARQLGVEDLVRFTGDQPDPMPYYHAADVFVLPTYYDPCSLVVLEAMACGLPVITTRNNGVHELMKDGQEGFIIDQPEDLESLTRGMIQLLDPIRRGEAGRAARALAERHSIERNCKEQVAVYEDFINSNGYSAT
ncbi:MAG: glycosyltransferase family 4 protein [Planctomycetota bacterium]|nr:glycosyltransferase family 4 protein [Planctomycetota bacterium]